jgi:hypothetical protein
MLSRFMKLPHQYAYNLPWRGAVIGALFYAGLSVLMFHLAKGLAGVVFLGLLAVSAIFAVLAVTMLTRRLVFPWVLELTDDAILLPRGFPRTRITRIPFTDIIRMSWTQTGLYVATAKGGSEITASHFKEIESYQVVTDFICAQSSIELPRRGEQKQTAWISEGFPDPILQWVESEDWPRYRTHLIASKPLLPRFAKALWFFARCFGVILLPWLLLEAFQLPTIPVAGYLWLAIPVAFFFTSLHWLNSTHPARATRISFRDRGITQLSGKQVRDLNYNECSGWEAVERRFEERVLHILLLQWRNHPIEVALPDVNTRDRLAQIFRDKQIPHRPDLKPSWEAHSSP